ncbi:MAG: 3'-flap repair endonuclease Xpf [Sulfolobaceae archaeon]
MIRIYVDERERASGVPDLLKRYNDLIIIFNNLSVGDYVISDTIGIERKSIEDLVSSVFDKRFFDQTKRLAEVYSNPILLIEGDISRIRLITEKWKAINAAIISISMDYGIRVFYSRDQEDSAEVIRKIAEKAHNESKRAISLHKKPKFESIHDVQRYIVESFPEIGTVLAERLLEKFNTIYNICNASISDLEKVIGRKKAEELYKIIRTPYTSSANPNKQKYKSLTDFL